MPSLWELLNSFEHTAFRLEVRDRYDEPDEAEPLARYLAGDRDAPAWMGEWLDLVHDATAAGRRFARVRVVTIPLTDYSRFGLWCSEFTTEAGEDIRYLPRDQADADVPRHDYWLFDSRILVRMEFDDNDAFLGTELISDPAEIVQHNYWRDAAWHRAVRRDDFASQQHL
ncbi:hypothetical protein EV649_7270 [Kribbella sp. VKM Ac-2569]|uniref:DUF6879 family protein n=1 Tax=Kribbella sp. VKM Ac-2569 TaxID=2512220 RepID=UPI00102B35C4|nr:DUF6879 family protein [Kribbella sp. VKM Ac-2569]RZT12901.1 hypothetical protein EV649_7270 [Kribbella sp. VKM Ac-2569]